jgi:predicted metal-dependent peptidase
MSKSKQLQLLRVKASRMAMTDPTNHSDTAWPYLSKALFSAEFVETDKVPTFAIDTYWRIYFNPDFASGLKTTELCAVLAHEVWHNILKHGPRAKSNGYDPQRWNMAGDYAINSMPKLANSLPEGCLHPSQKGWLVGKSSDYYYKLLDKEGREGGQPGHRRRDGQPGKPGKPDKGVGKGDCGSGADGKRRPWELGPPTKENPGLEEVQGEILRRGTLKDIKSSSRARGDMPSDLYGSAISALEPPKVRWQQVLQRHLNAAQVWVRGQSEYSYSSPSLYQAMAQPGVIYAGSVTPVPDVVVVQDTSGSMSNADIVSSMSEVQGIVNRVCPGGLRVIACDARAIKAQSLRDARKFRSYGRGGTDMRIGVEAALKAKPRPNVIIVMTDGYTPWPTSQPKGCRLIACIIGRMRSTSSVPAWLPFVEVG